MWGIPEGGLTESISEPLMNLSGHQKKVALVKFHPTASNVLGSVSGEGMVKVWDIEKGSEMVTCSAHDQLVQDFVWDTNGNSYLTTCKDKALRIIDARTGAVAQVSLFVC